MLAIESSTHLPKRRQCLYHAVRHRATHATLHSEIDSPKFPSPLPLGSPKNHDESASELLAVKQKLHRVPSDPSPERYDHACMAPRIARNDN
eukprot:9315964-Pyramimonas_sp.AAC.1